MKILAIDTSSATATAALTVDGVLKGEIILNSGKTHSQKLMTIIERLLEDTSTAPADIDVYACCSGPGSFTGLRIGAATIKAMAYAFQKPVVGVPTTDILAYNFYHSRSLICTVLDAQRDMVYTALYRWTDRELTRAEELKVVAVPELISRLTAKQEEVLLVGDGVHLFEGRLHAAPNIQIAPAVYQLPRAAACAALAEKLYNKGEAKPHDEFIPTYIRKSQAEVEYEKKLDVQVRDMRAEDVDGVFEIEKLSFKTPWSKESFAEEIEKNNLARYVVAIADNRVVGYGGMWLVLDEGHVTNIAVHPDYREMKIGEKIVQALIKTAEDNGIAQMTLEVRTSNNAARKLYQKLGFTDFGIRKGYYADTGEDAAIMWKDIKQP